jgi:uncharacterized protein (DUF488 family)
MTHPGGVTVIYTIGHGNRSAKEFVGLLEGSGIGCIIDVRAYPASRRHPQFARAALEDSLARAGIRYVWEGQAMGGRRRPVKDSPHTALTSPGFRAYADHMMADEFQRALDRLAALARERPAAIMCAERLPWQCHRYLISDTLVARGFAVDHIVVPGQIRNHELSRLARIREGGLIYDSSEQLGLGL